MNLPLFGLSIVSFCLSLFSLSIDVAGLLVGRLKDSMMRATGRLRSEKVVDAHTIVGDTNASFTKPITKDKP
jgi:hypothetical protein